MANEIQFGFRTGATLTYGAYEPDGTVRTAATTSLPEIAATGYYTVTDANIVAGDAVIIKEGTNEVGSGIYQPEATVANISAVQSGLGTTAQLDSMSGAGFNTNTDSLEEISDAVGGIPTGSGAPQLK